MTKKQDLPHISKRIVELREARGLSQKDLGTLAGVTAPAITMWETGKRFPRGKNLKNLAKALGVPESAILDDTAPPPVRPPESSPADKMSLIGSITMRLGFMDEDQLETVLTFVEGLPVVQAHPTAEGRLELSQRAKSIKQAKD